MSWGGKYGAIGKIRVSSRSPANSTRPSTRTIWSDRLCAGPTVRERGADGWSLREASARIGVSPSAAYHHFGSRDALVSALSEIVLARLGHRLRDAVEAAQGQGPERLAACGHIDDREGLACQTDRLVFATFNGLARETAPDPDRPTPTPTTTHTRRLAPHTSSPSSAEGL
ncbi:hypothetical protein Slala02_53570 [Streptomyces lavendulae subsp. lavendulae]|nr:hypothetical protein Slala01_06740 [Streptomyces lavendulae subsp. lavendulae]GLX29537.1 hypothetical protein Slala02_53570 [Streptomyces lavendulae subsp. lavendulae]